MAKAKKDPTASFWGEEKTPDSFETLYQRPLLPGTGQIPTALQRMQTAKSFYLDANDKEQMPSMQYEKIKLDTGELKWKVELPNSNAQATNALGLKGQQLVLESPEFFDKTADKNTSFHSFRPDWNNGTYFPQLLSNDDLPKLKRFKGQEVNPLFVFGPDDRRVMMDASWPWGLVGRVFSSNGMSGTGALISPTTIVTAGHLVPWGQGDWWMRFVPAYFDGASLYGAGVESNISSCYGYNVRGELTGYDWAVCRLYEPLGASLGYFGASGYTNNWNNLPAFTIMGYPGAVASGERPSFQHAISVVGSDGDRNGGLEIEHFADVTRGNSGGPMFGWWNGDPRLIGVVAGEEMEWTGRRVNVVAGGNGFVNLIIWARNNWM
jgi:V8-like Glu-specific endopeptidase